MSSNSEQSMRQDVAAKYGIIVPDKNVISDTPDDFSYTASNGTIVGWTRNTEIFWRNRIDLSDNNAKSL